MLVVWLKKTTDFNTKDIEIEGKIPDVSSLVKKTDCAADITNIKNDYVTNSALNARHKDLIQKTNFDTELKKNDDGIASNSSEVLTYNNRLSQSKDRIDNLERYASYFRGKNYFDGNDGAQNSLIFQVGEKYFKNNFGSNSSKIEIWKSKPCDTIDPDKYIYSGYGLGFDRTSQFTHPQGGNG